MKYKKIIKIIFMNVLVFTVLACSVEFYSYNKLQEKHAEYLNYTNKIIAKSGKQLKLKYGRIRAINYSIDKNYFRPTKLRSKSKRPIVFFGCSFIYGKKLNNQQTLPYKISKLTNRTVYNRAYNGWGAQHVLYQLRREDFKKEVPDAEYIIYTFIYEHLNRFYAYNLCDFSFATMLRYKIKGNNITEIKPAFLPFYSLFTVRYIQDAIVDKKNNNIDDLLFMFDTVMNENLRLSRKKFPNSKFVILIYKDTNPVSELVQNKFNENLIKLKNKGFIIIDSQDLVGHNFDKKEYLSDDNWHPSEKAWNEIAPKLVEYLKL